MGDSNDVRVWIQQYEKIKATIQGRRKFGQGFSSNEVGI